LRPEARTGKVQKDTDGLLHFAFLAKEPHQEPGREDRHRTPMQIQLRNIHKHYGSVRANDGIHLTVDAGKIHGILGENGAGKSTLMKILSGYCEKTGGQILLDGKAVDYRTPAEAERLGIGMLYQDPLDFPVLSVLDNFMLGQARGVSVRKRGFCKQFQHLADDLDFQLNPAFPVRNLTIGERQQLEILRLLAKGVSVLILDEPTTGISATQRDVLFNALKRLVQEDRAIVLVSHKLEDVEAWCDRVTVLRQGKVSGEADRPFETNSLLSMMFGAPPIQPSRSTAAPGNRVLRMKQVSASGGRSGLKDCDLVVRQSEIIGLAGLEGSGQEMFLRVACGLKRPSQGTVELLGQDMHQRDHRSYKRSGVTFVPAARLEEGLIPGLTISEHFALLDESRDFWVKWDQATRTAQARIDQFRIKGMPQSPAQSLSGGNQQRLLLSMLPANPVLLLLENPTRGLDMESGLWIWQHLLAYGTSGASIVFSSSELDEILMVANRVLVFFNGRIITDLPCDRTTVQELGRAIAGRV
jgi:ABC-type uncharacterized transport system ATPase subunit